MSAVIGQSALVHVNRGLDLPVSPSQGQCNTLTYCPWYSRSAEDTATVWYIAAGRSHATAMHVRQKYQALKLS